MPVTDAWWREFRAHIDELRRQKAEIAELDARAKRRAGMRFRQPTFNEGVFLAETMPQHFPRAAFRVMEYQGGTYLVAPFGDTAVRLGK